MPNVLQGTGARAPPLQEGSLGCVVWALSASGNEKSGIRVDEVVPGGFLEEVEYELESLGPVGANDS